MTSHMTGCNRKRTGTVKYKEVPNRNVRDIMDRLESRKPVHQAKRGKQASPMRTRLIVVVNPIMPTSLRSNNRESRTLPQDEQNCCGCLRTFAIALANSRFARSAGKNPMEGHAKTPQGQLSLTRHAARSQCCFFQKDIPHPMKTSKWRFLMI